MASRAYSAAPDDPRPRDAGDTLQSPRMIARVLLDCLIQDLTRDGYVHSIDLFAALGSVGGFSCILAALDIASAGQLRDGADLVVVETKDGSRYYAGNLPNAFLLESHDSFLNLTYGAARQSGGLISQEMVMETFRHVAATIGHPQFGISRLLEEHRPGDTPLIYVRRLWPKVAEILDRHLVPIRRRPLAIGMALELAFVSGKPPLDPSLAARIVTECAVPMAKLDPRSIA
ncbi:hypothetical protein [Rhizobium anhuiense]|jgi:hypothetical protein|uniref:Uncharacterized protein n=2 Tax=Rhizobium anhuiense TaxID=1184720 RepID=A0A3S0SSJ5_9HYPH|nr:hypothetical protein [Rhizobium anhuiense]NKM57333.1 hypothetical protein [Rhizobium anhuiense]RUM03214.1 hypothetical protein EEQ99_08455 [Rhizobium anhuiense]UTS89958.1 hypothetical protein NE851_25640 [Rhizobium anhuiense bv. trifolii]